MGAFVRPVLMALGGAAAHLLTPLGAQAPELASPGAAARHVDRARLMRTMSVLAEPAFEGRSTGSPGAIRAREWLVGEFRSTGLAPGGTEGFLQPFVAEARDTRSGAPEPGARPAVRAAANVIGRAPGLDVRASRLVILAHYDHLGIRDGVRFPGADDNASGVAVLLEAARHFVVNPPRHPIVFAALDAEEIGLRGARTLLDSTLLPRHLVALAVNLDMVARNTKNEIFAAGTYHTPWLRPLLVDVQTRSTVTIRFGHDRPDAQANGLDDWTGLSDHAPFHEAGIPFVYFGVEDHGDYHRPTDTAGRIEPRFFGDTADMIVEAVRTLDRRVD